MGSGLPREKENRRCRARRWEGNSRKAGAARQPHIQFGGRTAAVLLVIGSRVTVAEWHDVSRSMAGQLQSNSKASKGRMAGGKHGRDDEVAGRARTCEAVFHDSDTM